MVSSTVMVTFMGFYFLYGTSKRAPLNFDTKLQKWINQHPKQGKNIGLVLLVLAAALCISTWGIGAGIFSFFALLMTLGSLIVLISPLRFFGRIGLLSVAIICLGLEYVIN